MTDSVIPEAFVQQVHDCLSNYYDYSYLRTHPLVKALAPQSVGEAIRIQDFRRMIDDLLEGLHQMDDAASKYARTYKILYFRYIDQLPIQQILHQLGLSERQYYRDHAKALETVTQILWDRLHGVEQAEKIVPVPTPAISIQSEISRLHQRDDSAQFENLKDLLESTLMALHGLAEQRGVTVRLHPFEDLLGLYIDPTVLRQAIIWIISQLLNASTNPTQIDLYCERRGNRLCLMFTTSGQPALALEEQEVLRYLVAALGATLHNEGQRVTLAVPAGNDSLLIIDDNPDALDLLKSYLVGQPYHVLTALDGKLGIQLARENQPSVIVLDIMLPKQDGWEILQNIKHYPTTRHIPVLICSVLDTPDLAISLGADCFLKKPPTETEFRNAIAVWHKRASSVT